MWRMADDFWDDWKAIIGMIGYAEQWQGKKRPRSLARLRYDTDWQTIQTRPGRRGALQ